MGVCVFVCVSVSTFSNTQSAKLSNYQVEISKDWILNPSQNSQPTIFTIKSKCYVLGKQMTIFNHIFSKMRTSYVSKFIARVLFIPCINEAKGLKLAKQGSAGRLSARTVGWVC